MSRETVLSGRKKDGFGAIGMEEAGADTAALAPKTRVSGLQLDHVNEPVFDEKRAEAENGISDSEIWSLATRQQDSR
jgi:hypothetical protein